MKKLFWVIVVVVILILGGVAIFFSQRGRKNDNQNFSNAEKREVPKDKATCEKEGGRWYRIGLAPTESCNLKARDFGKECNDAAQCEGRCLAEEQKKNVGVTKGKCSEWTTVVGCIYLLENGHEKQICYD